MTVDISKIRVGDMVTVVPLEVVSPDLAAVKPVYDNPFVKVRMPSGDIYVAFSDQIAAHHPRNFQIGDRVKAKDWPDTGTVAGVYAHEVWVKWDGDSDHHPIWPADRLVVLEP